MARGRDGRREGGGREGGGGEGGREGGWEASTAATARVARAALEQVDYGRWILFSLMHTGAGSSGAVGAASAARSL